MDGKEAFTIFGGLLGLLGLFIGGGSALDNHMHESRCRQTAETMGVEYRYSMNMPCMVKVNGQFVPLSVFKVLQ